LPHHAAAAVAADQVVGTDLREPLTHAVTPVSSWSRPVISDDQCTRPPQLDETRFEQSLDPRLEQHQRVRVTRVESAEVQRDGGEVAGLHRAALGLERREHAALIEQLEGAWVQATGSRFTAALVETVDDVHVNAGQAEFAGQHQAGRAGAGDQDARGFHRISLTLFNERR